MASLLQNRNMAASTIKQETAFSQYYELFNYSLNTPTNPADESQIDIIDDSSRKGKFGWAWIFSRHLPYILRNGYNYFPLQMVKMILPINMYSLNSNVYECITIPCFSMTKIEAWLCNKINFSHCDGMYGSFIYSTGDLLLKEEDVFELFKFLDFCYRKIYEPDPSLNKVGYLLFNHRHIVPYVLKDGKRYTSLQYYLDRLSYYSTVQPIVIHSWDYSYLKFVFKYIGSQYGFTKDQSCEVLCLDDLFDSLDYMAEFLLEEYWPNTPSDAFEESNYAFESNLANEDPNYLYNRIATMLAELNEQRMQGTQHPVPGTSQDLNYL